MGISFMEWFNRNKRIWGFIIKMGVLGVALGVGVGYHVVKHIAKDVDKLLREGR